MIMKKTNILFFCMIFLAVCFNSFTSLVSAYDYVVIDIESSFQQDEYTYFNYTFTGFIGEVEYYVGVRCDDLPAGFYLEKANITSRTFTRQYAGFKVDKQYQNCYAYVYVIKPFEIIATKPFIIQNASSEFNFDLKTCKDFSCLEESIVFLKNENMYLSYGSSVENPSINAVLTSPDGTTKQINLPSSIKAEQIGTYILEATASKEGYKTVSLTEQFGVIEKEAVIKSLKVGEEVKYKEIFKEKKIWIFAILIIILIIVVFIILVFLKKKKT